MGSAQVSEPISVWITPFLSTGRDVIVGALARDVFINGAKDWSLAGVDVFAKDANTRLAA